MWFSFVSILNKKTVQPKPYRFVNATRSAAFLFRFLRPILQKRLDPHCGPVNVVAPKPLL